MVGESSLGPGLEALCSRPTPRVWQIMTEALARVALTARAAPPNTDCTALHAPTHPHAAGPPGSVQATVPLPHLWPYALSGWAGRLQVDGSPARLLRNSSKIWATRLSLGGNRLLEAGVASLTPAPREDPAQQLATQPWAGAPPPPPARGPSAERVRTPASCCVYCKEQPMAGSTLVKKLRAWMKENKLL